MCYAHRFFYRLNFFWNRLRYSLTYWSILLLMRWSGSGLWLIINVIDNWCHRYMAIYVTAHTVMEGRLLRRGYWRSMWWSPVGTNTSHRERCTDQFTFIRFITRRRRWFMNCAGRNARTWHYWKLIYALFTFVFWLTLNYLELHHYYYLN